MRQDPFYRKIIEGLNGELDRDLFEDCAADILRTNHPTLVPIRGGQDAGMDGAVADSMGEPFPLVTTTGKKVSGNLGRNLDSYVENGGIRRKVILATTQSLTPRRINYLYTVTRKKGFTLIQIYEQVGIANLLYRDPAWCRDLLGITGDPPALSTVPIGARSAISIEPIGRRGELDWLRNNNEDVLLVGQPGSGKTFLMHKLAMESKGLFAISSDRGELANSMRELNPNIVFVDDAGYFDNLLLALRHIRQELDLSFTIIASCWPSDTNELVEKLNLSHNQVFQLNLLDREKIVKIINAVGIKGPNQLVREIVDQSGGRPGLAITLTNLCIQREFPEFISGDALMRASFRFFDSADREIVKSILASIAIGGDFGMKMKVVADYLQLPLIEVRGHVTLLATGGILRELDNGYLAVYPMALRCALVREIFFSGANSLPIPGILAQAPNQGEATRVLIHSKGRGASIPFDLLADRVFTLGYRNSLEEFAGLGKEEAKWVFDRFPQKVIDVAKPLLNLLPEIVISRLMELAVSDQRPLPQNLDQPLRVVQDWVRSGRRETGESLVRRELLIEIALGWLSDGKDVNTGLRGIEIALSPVFEIIETDPGLGDTITINRGYVTFEQINQIQSHWQKIIDVFKRITINNWDPMKNIIHEWVYQMGATSGIPLEWKENMRAFGELMLVDLVSIAKDQPGVMHWVNQISQNLDLKIDVPLEAEFQILFPNDAKDYEEFKEIESGWASDALELAIIWSQQGPKVVCQQVAKIERAAGVQNISWPRFTPFLFQEIAKRTESSLAWAKEAVEAGLSGDLLFPLLKAAAETDQEGWDNFAKSCISDDQYRLAIINLGLTVPAVPDDLFAEVLNNLNGLGGWIKILVLRGEITNDILQTLLEHQDGEISGAIAIGEWERDPKGKVNPTLYDSWKKAIINMREDDYWLSQILLSDPEIAYEWLQQRLEDEEPEKSELKDSFKKAPLSLDITARKKVLRKIPGSLYYHDLLFSLVGDEIDIYEELLNNIELKDFHLTPLARHPEGVWLEFAILALDAGYTSEQVAGAVYGYPINATFWSGSEAKMWGDWVDRFDKLCKDEDERIKKLGEVGRAQAQISYQRAFAREKNEEIYGRGQ